MSKYVVDGAGLTSIADAIREEKGLNMYDPVADKGYVRPNTKYTFSKTIISDGSSVEIDMCYLVGGFIASVISYMFDIPPTAGTSVRIDATFTTDSDTVYVENKSSGLTESNIQLEKGNTATTYNAFQKLEFPDGFVSTLHN